MKPEGEGWMPNVGVRPATGEKYVDAVLRNGQRLVLTTTFARWSFASGEEKLMYDRDIIWWKPLDTEEERK